MKQQYEKKLKTLQDQATTSVNKPGPKAADVEAQIQAVRVSFLLII